MTDTTNTPTHTDVEARRLLISGTAPADMVVSESLYLSGTSITALPDNLTVGESLDLSGCPNLVFPTTWYSRGGATRWRAIAADRNYTLHQSDTGALHAGCRDFATAAEGLAHWGRRSRKDKRAKLFAAAIRAVTEVAAAA